MNSPEGSQTLLQPLLLPQLRIDELLLALDVLDQCLRLLPLAEATALVEVIRRPDSSFRVSIHLVYSEMLVQIHNLILQPLIVDPQVLGQGHKLINGFGVFLEGTCGSPVFQEIGCLVLYPLLVVVDINELLLDPSQLPSQIRSLRLEMFATRLYLAHQLGLPLHLFPQLPLYDPHVFSQVPQPGSHLLPPPLQIDLPYPLLKDLVLQLHYLLLKLLFLGVVVLELHLIFFDLGIEHLEDGVGDVLNGLGRVLSNIDRQGV